MPALQVSLSSAEISVLDEEAQTQTKRIRDALPEPDRSWDSIPLIVASTVAAQILRKAIVELEKENE